MVVHKVIYLGIYWYNTRIYLPNATFLAAFQPKQASIQIRQINYAHTSQSVVLQRIPKTLY